MLFQFVERDQEADGIMPCCAGEAQEQGDVRLKFHIIAGQLEQSVAEVILVQVAVPAPGRIRVREMPQAVRSAIPVMPVGAGVGMYSGSVPGDSKVLLWYEAAFPGRKDSHMVEELLQALFKVEGISVPAMSRFSMDSVVLCFVSCAFWCLPLGLSGFLRFQEAGSSLSRAYKPVAGAAQSLSMKSK